MTEMVYKRREASLPLFTLIASHISLERYLAYACNKIRTLSNNDRFWGTLEALLFSLVLPLKKLPYVTEEVALLINTYGEGGLG